MRRHIRPLYLLAALGLAACAESDGDAVDSDASVLDAASTDASDAADAADAALDPTPPDAGDTADSHDASPPPMACNGHVELCDRTFDTIVLAGTHNSMSTQDDGFIAPNQNRSMAQQLEDGIRAMLIDTYRDGDGLALCHGDCAFGRSDAIEQLGGIATFLREHPHEVMAFIFQDGVSADDSVAMLEQSGLAELALVPPAPGEPWPTLREMIERDTRVLLTHESGRSGPDWFPRAWDVFVDTPYSFETVDDFSCRRNRGPEDAPLRLLNHWLGSPLPWPWLAEEANPRDVLQPRADACTEAWGAPPTIVAVDFYDIGALFEVVDALNGVTTR